MSSSPDLQSVEQLLSDDHTQLDALLKALRTAIDKSDTESIFAHLDLFWARLAMHIRAEHLHLFPAIIKRMEGPALLTSESAPPVEILDSIARLRRDHDFFMHELAAGIKTVRALKDIGHLASGDQSMSSVAASIAAVSERLESHNKVEEELVYRLPVRVLTPAEQEALAEGVRRELQNVPPRFSDECLEAREK